MHVLKPWTDVKFENLEDGVAVQVWGRTYTFQNSLFPSSIISAGKEILFAPIELALTFGLREGTTYHYQYRVMDASDERVQIICAALCENIIINSAITIEFDGYMSCSVSLAPFGGISNMNIIQYRKPENGVFCDLSKAVLRVKMNKEASTLFHYWPNGENSVKSELHITSGKYKEMTLPFKPCVWAGCEDYGLNICIESDDAFQLSDPAMCIQTTIGKAYNMIEYTLMDATPLQWMSCVDDFVSTHEPICYDFIFQATPVKQFDRQLENDWRVLHTCRNDEDFEKAAACGVKWIIFHEHWALIQNYGPAFDEFGLKAAIQKCHSLGMKVMVYFGYEYSTAHPDWNKKAAYYCNVSQRGTFTGGWHRDRILQRDNIVCYNSEYSDVLLARIDMVMKEYGVDGIYTDQTYIPWGCANKSHGCGYTGRDGKLHVTYPINALRALCKKLYTAAHENGGLMDAHQSTCCMMPTMSFADTYFDGENLQVYIAKQLEEFVSMEAFRCEFLGRPFGLICNFVTVLSPGFEMRNLLSLTLIHNVIARAWGIDKLDVVSKIWNGYDTIGIVDAKWCPYWEKNGSLSCKDDKVYISTFEKENTILAFVSQFNKSTIEVEISIPDGFTTATELFDEQSYRIKDGKLKCQLVNRTAYAFIINK